MMTDAEYWRRMFFDLIHMLRDPGEMPPAAILKYLPGKFPEDYNRGKEMQAEISDHNERWKKIPYKTECEIGAGYWQRTIKPLAERKGE